VKVLGAKGGKEKKKGGEEKKVPAFVSGVMEKEKGMGLF